MISEKQRRRFWARVLLPDADGHMLWTGHIGQNGYGQVGINNRAIGTHRLALILTEGPPPSERMEAAHAPVICHLPACVAPVHLRWAKRIENAADQLKDGTRVRGEMSPHAKLTAEAVREIRQRYEAGRVYQRELAAEYGVDQALISRIVNRHENWAYLP